MTGKTIIYLPNWLGDMVMATPLLYSLRASLDGEFWGIGKTNAMHIYNGLGFFDRFIPLDKKGFIPFLDTVTFLKNRNFARGIILPHSFHSALLLYAARVKERIGYARNKRGFMLTHTVEERAASEPMVEHYLRIIDTLGEKRMQDTPVLALTEDEEQKFDEKYTDFEKPYAVFIIGAKYGPSKRWPDVHFSELADMVIEKYGMKVYLLPGKDEKKLARLIQESARNKEFVVNRFLEIRDLKVCLSRASIVVSNDTGPRHVSAALSTPTIVLLGPMDNSYTHYASSCTYPMSEDVPCKPCNKKKCDRDHECLKAITPQMVFKTLEEILDSKR